MANNVGYTNKLFILPFDHRASFVKNLFKIVDREASETELEQIKDVKKLIYEGYQRALEKGVPASESAILVDEQFGGDILKDAVSRGFSTLLTVEKSGQDVFDFEYGDDFRSHVEGFHPTFVKALVRHNPDMDAQKRYLQLSRLKILSDFADTSGYKFLIEPLIPPLSHQLDQVEGSVKRFDTELRPILTIAMIQQMHEAGIEPDVWKIEGMHDSSSYQQIVDEVRKNERSSVGVVILGRGEKKQSVEEWLMAGKGIEGIIGFAIGRTVFWEPLVKFRQGELDRGGAAEEIADNFCYFYKLFTQ